MSFALKKAGPRAAEACHVWGYTIVGSFTEISSNEPEGPSLKILAPTVQLGLVLTWADIGSIVLKSAKHISVNPGFKIFIVVILVVRGFFLRLLY